jgi:hypothetical protein
VAASGADDQLLVEVFSSPGCPHHDTAVMLIRLIAGDLGLPIDLRIVNVADADAAASHRSLGSPTIRIAGCDVEPGAERRTTYTHECRAYIDADGVAGAPNPVWIRAALLRAR